jgi:hypothetical protein
MRTLNIERPTSNIEHRSKCVEPLYFDVGRSKLDVRYSHLFTSNGDLARRNCHAPDEIRMTNQIRRTKFELAKTDVIPADEYLTLTRFYREDASDYCGLSA